MTCPGSGSQFLPCFRIHNWRDSSPWQTSGAAFNQPFISGSRQIVNGYPHVPHNPASYMVRATVSTRSFTVQEPLPPNQPVGGWW